MPGGWGGGPAPVAGPLRYELFVTFAPADRAWVLGFMLPALGLAEDRVITAEQFRPGAPVVDEFERAVTTSRYTAVVVSNAYLADAWSTFGEQLTSFASVGGADRLIPAVLEPCEVPLRVDFRVRLDLTDESRWEEQLARLRGLLEQSDPGMEELPCPYPGMQVFTQDQAQWFYGREDESEQLLRRLRQQSLVVVIGPSGAGKSSLVFAGVLPRLVAGGPSSGSWVIRSLRPGAHPTKALAVALETDAGELAVGERAGEVVGGVLARVGGGRLLLVVDQLEEVFAQANRGEQVAFFDRLRVLRDDVRCVLLVTVRADFYAELMTCPLWPLGPGERFEVVPLAGAALARAIQEPAADVGVHLQSELVQRLVDDAAGEPGVLPFVQETLVLLWQQRQRRLLTVTAYDRLGGEGRSALTAAIAEKADATVSALTPRERAIARRILLRLVQLGEGRQDTRRQEPVVALRSSAESQSEFDTTLQHLTANRLLTLSGRESDQPRVDLSHEALISGWPQLHEWIRDNRDNLRMQRAVFEDAQRWDELGRDPEALYRGARLEAAGVWADAHHDELNALEQAFVQASRTDAAARLRRQRRTTLVLRGLSVFLLLALVAASYQWADARSKEQVAQRVASRYRALEAGAYDGFHGNMAFRAGGSVLAVTDVTSDIDEIDDAKVTLWDVDSKQVTSMVIRGADALATSVTFSPDGDRVAWAYARDRFGEIVVWDIENNELVMDPISETSGYVFDLAFTEDGKSLSWKVRKGDAIVNAVGGDVVLWDFDAKERYELRLPPDWVIEEVDLSPDGKVARLFLIDIDEVEDQYSLVFWDVEESSAIGGPVTSSELLRDEDTGGWMNAQFLASSTTAVIETSHGDVFLWEHRERSRRDLEGLAEGDWEITGESSDGRMLYVESERRLLVFDTESGDVTLTLDLGTLGHVVELDADRSLAVVGSFGESDEEDQFDLAVWNVRSGKRVGVPVSLASLGLVDLQINPDSMMHAIVAEHFGESADESALPVQTDVLLWDADTGQLTSLASTG
jgi:WD40 repeat protein